MEVESGKKYEVVDTTRKTKMLVVVVVLCRLGALGATVAAAVVMGLNKQTKTLTMAMVGTASITQTLVAKFQHTPAFVYFVIANAIASGYNLSVLLVTALVKCKSLNLLIHLLDMVILALVASGVTAAATIGELARNGNFHSRWFPICDKFISFCDQGRVAIIAGFVGASLLLIMCTLSTIVIYKNVVKP